MMMRSNPATSMQKTYDDCFLVCSTAVYFESKNNEAEALRSWKNALDQIYYHNAYRMPANYKPKTETERALMDSLKQMELQCRERVDLLEALKQSREEAEGKGDGKDAGSNPANANPFGDPRPASEEGWLGSGTVPPINYPDLARPPLPKRPSITSPRPSTTSTPRPNITPRQSSQVENMLAPLPMPEKVRSRTPSPDKKQGMLKTLRPARKKASDPPGKVPKSLRPKPPAAAKAATQAWEVTGSSSRTDSERTGSLSTDAARSSVLAFSQASTASTGQDASGAAIQPVSSEDDVIGGLAITHSLSLDDDRTPGYPSPRKAREPRPSRDYGESKSSENLVARVRQPVATITNDQQNSSSQSPSVLPDTAARPSARLPKLNPAVISYRKEYPDMSAEQRLDPQSAVKAARRKHGLSTLDGDSPGAIASARSSPNVIRRKAPNARTPAANTTFSRTPRQPRRSSASEEFSSSSYDQASAPSAANRARGKRRSQPESDTPPSDASAEEPEEDDNGGIPRKDSSRSKRREADAIIRKLPKGVDEAAARQVLNEVVTHGDEVHWGDIAGLEPAKNALKEAVVYPFLRPDLFSGLREPARGMLLFGPPGTGKTMLARAVATESRSTFFAISASSLVSKWMGESEKLVRALFALAKVLAPSIIFVDEIDSLLGSRGGSSEHEATRRVKTEFLIQWSDLQRAAAGRESKDTSGGDASRVLVLAATNLPWAIDEAARRRFVRRQYIPLPEDHVREKQLRTLFSHQKHSLSDVEIVRLVQLTDGFSGSDITALAKDAAMGPLRSLGEKLLEMDFDDIRPVSFADFRASLATIRPSVSREGLKQFEEWARAYGERAG